MAARVAGLILAGGRGERYGVPKAFATLPDERTFLSACLEALTAGGAAPVVATVPPGTEAQAARFGAELTTIALPADGLDMFASLRLGLGRLSRDGLWRAVIVLPVDHPLIAAETVQALADTHAVAAIATYRGKHGHPVLLSRSLADGIVSGASLGPTLREVLRGVERTDVNVDDAGVIANCNSPERLAAAWSERARSE
jgi:CTP:molybdopterin cytidylyltransferase MocA